MRGKRAKQIRRLARYHPMRQREYEEEPGSRRFKVWSRLLRELVYSGRREAPQHVFDRLAGVDRPWNFFTRTARLKVTDARKHYRLAKRAWVRRYAG